MEELMHLVAKVVAPLPNPIAISGHTDSHAFARENYSNWELSADRANAARRSLMASGIPTERTWRVLGYADKQPLMRQDPADPRNRRIAILLMSQVRKSGGAP
jgi:chemotaxis protein MotB